jgi:hypothetical protein
MTTAAIRHDITWQVGRLHVVRGLPGRYTTLGVQDQIPSVHMGSLVPRKRSPHCSSRMRQKFLWYRSTLWL